MNKVESILARLNCSRRALGNILAVPEIEISDAHPRVCVLHILIGADQRSAAALLEILNRHVFEDLEGNVDSVLSALQTDKYELETLIHIKNISEQSLGAP